MRMQYTAHRKLGLLASVKRSIMEEEGLSLRQAAEQLMVCHSCFVKGQKQQAAKIGPTLALLKSKKKASFTGLLGQLTPIEDALLQYIFEQREKDQCKYPFSCCEVIIALA